MKTKRNVAKLKENAMKKITIYEPAPCCDKDAFDYCVFCGCDCCDCSEPIRISRIYENLKMNGVIMQRYDLGSFPQEFITNTDISKLIVDEGKEVLPVTVVDDKIVKTKEYPLSDEIVSWLNIPCDYYKA